MNTVSNPFGISIQPVSRIRAATVAVTTVKLALVLLEQPSSAVPMVKFWFPGGNVVAGGVGDITRLVRAPAKVGVTDADVNVPVITAGRPLTLNDTGLGAADPATNVSVTA